MRNTGTIGLLLRAYRERMLISFGETLEELESSGFRLHKNLKEILLQETSTLMKQTEAISRLESKYLDQARELVLKATADLNCTIFLFGSRARTLHRRSSDIDIGFSGLSEAMFVRTRDRLLSELEESLVPHHVDLVNIDTAPSDFRNVALKEVIVWKQSSRAS